MAGIKKCILKKNFSVTDLIMKPLRRYSKKRFPNTGRAETRFVITVAPHRDICPQGRTYPRKASAMVSKKIVTPTFHVIFAVTCLVK